MAERVMRGEAHQKTNADQAHETGDATSVLQVSPQPDAQWSPAFDVINDGISLIDPEGRIIRCNAAMAKLSGLPKEEVVGKYCFSVVHGLEKPIPECPIVAMHASRHRETLEILLNGRWFRVSADPIFDAVGEVAGGMHILTDISDRTQVEAALRESETKYRALYQEFQGILNGIPDILSLISPDLRIVWANEKSAKTFNAQLSNTIGRHCYQVRHHRSEPCENCPVQRSFRSGALESGEVPSPDGALWDMRAIPLVDERGEMKGVIELCRNITERTRAEEALRQSELSYRTIFDSATDAIFLHDVETGRILEVNEAACKLWGYNREELKASDLGIVSFGVPPYTSKEAMEWVRRGVEEGPQSFDWIARRRDGTPIWFENSLKVITIGGKERVLVVGHDITERKRTELELRAIQQRLGDIIEFLPDATFVIDHERKVIAWNKALEELTGTRKQDLLDKGDYEYALPFYGVKRPVLLDLVFEPDADIKANYGYVERRGTTLMAEGFLPRAREGKGAYFWAVASPLCDEEGNVVGAIESVRDITERRRAEKVLRESEERFRELAELLPETVFEMDMEGKLTFVNRSALEQFKYTLEDFAAGVNGMELLASARREGIREEVRKVLQGEERTFGPLELMVRRKDGTEFPAMVHANAVIREGKTRSFRGIVVDMTRQKRLETQLLQSQKLEAIGTLAGGIAHDFNNILMAIQGRASLVAMNLGDKNPYYQDLHSIEELVGRGADLTRQLLGFARGGKYEVRLTNLNALIAKNSELFGRTKKEVTIHRTFKEGLWAVEVDQGQIEQVLLNVYVNAWQAMPGGGSLYLETENAVIDETYVKPFKVAPGKYVKVTVTDTGVGMDEKTKARIFEPFFTTREMGRGTGLGLATAYGIVKNHGGIINVYSEKGHGTTFTIYLPASEKEVRREEKKRAEVIKGTGTVLLVDDEKVIREVGSAMLEALGYRVFAAAQGEEAVDMYRAHQHKIDLVILDMIMPGISGGETYDRLRGIDPKVKVLLSSGYSVNGQAQKILDRGCDGFIQKPFDVTMLSYKIKEILG